MIPAFHPADHLPVGRFPATLDEIRERFVDAAEYSTSATRQVIWPQFEAVTALLSGIVSVKNLWLSGSFLSAKTDPDDLDIVYWCEDLDVISARATRAAGELAFVDQVATNQLRKLTGARLDTRIAIWHSQPTSPGGSTPDHALYAQTRGYWDDLWLRRRSGEKSDPPAREDSYPRRGYLEVMLDGFDGR